MQFACKASKKVLEFKNSNLNKDHMILPLLNSTDMIGRKAELFLPKKFANVIWKVFRAPKITIHGKKDLHHQIYFNQHGNITLSVSNP